MNLFQLLLVQPIINILVGIYSGLTFLHIPSSLGFSIILLTVVIRLILYPFTASQLKASRKMQQLTPHLSKLKEKHKGDAQRLQKETMALYKEHGVNPAAGCLPVVIQLPVIWALYYVLQHVVTFKLSEINNQLYFPSLHLAHIWNTTFFGLSLGSKPSELVTHVGPLILLIPLLTGVLQFIQTKMMFVQPAPVESKELRIKNQGGKTKEVKKEGAQDFATAFQTQSMYIFPVMIAFFSYTFPLGLSLYWNTFTIFGILQQYQLQGLGGLEAYFPKKPGTLTKTK